MKGPLTPAELRAAKADPNLRRRLPVIDSVRFRVPGRVDRGRHRLRVSVAADPVPACGRFAERAATAPIVVRT